MNLLIKFIVFFTLSIGTTSLSFAQNNRKNTKQIEAIKLSYISNRLDLSSEESQAFWPLYKNYQAELNALFRQKKQARVNNANNPEKTVDDDFYFDGKILELRKNYRKAFGKLLRPEKVKKLYQAERSFREELIKQLKNRSQGN